MQTVKRPFTCRDNIRALQVGLENEEGTVHKFPAIVWDDITQAIHVLSVHGIKSERQQKTAKMIGSRFTRRLPPCRWPASVTLTETVNGFSVGIGLRFKRADGATYLQFLGCCLKQVTIELDLRENRKAWERGDVR